MDPSISAEADGAEQVVLQVPIIDVLDARMASWTAAQKAGRR